MRLVRIVLRFAAALLVLLLIGGTLALQSGVQTWAARRYLASRPGWHASLGKVAAGLDHVSLRDLRIERDGVVLTLPALEADVPPLALLLGHPAPIRRLAAKGWTLDLTRLAAAAPDVPAPASAPAASLIPSVRAAPAAPPPEAQAVFRGLFGRLALPAGLSLEEVEGEGDLLLPPPGGPAGLALRAHARISGGGLVPGRSGRFDFDLAQTLPPGASPLNSVTVRGNLEAALDGNGVFARLGLRLHAAARGVKLPGEVRLSGEFGAVRGPAGEDYTASLRRDGKELASVSAAYAPGAPRLDGAWKFNLTDSDVSPFALGRVLPIFAFIGSGRFDTDETLALAHASGELNATCDRLGAIWPRLGGIGQASLKADFDLTHRHGLIRVDHLRASLAGAKPVLTAEAMQAFAFNADSGELQVADAARDLLSIDIEGVPMEWIWPFLPDVRLTGSPIHGRFTASARSGGLALHSVAPLEIGGFSLARDGRLLAQDLDLSVGLSADYTPRGWQAEAAGHVSNLAAGADIRKMAPDLTPILTFSARCGRLAGPGQPVKLAGHFAGHLPAWAAQPGFPALPAFGFATPLLPVSGTARIASGAIDGDFSASLGGQRSLQAGLTVTDLALASDLGTERWTRITAGLRADLGKDGRTSFSSPWTFERPDRKSDLTIEGTLAGTRRGLAFDGRVSSSVLAPDDAKVMAALWGLPQALATGAPDGRLALALKRVENGRWSATGVKGVLYAVPGALEIDDISGNFASGGDFKVKGALGMGPARAGPYSLQAEVTMNDFDAAPVFRALNPERPPILEGICSVTARLTGRGANPREVLSRISGDFVLGSRKGVIRALRAEVMEDIRQSPSRLSKAVDSVTSLFGKSDAAKSFIDKQGQVVVKITEAFKEIHYDQLRIRANRDSALSLHLPEFSLISPEIRLAGQGRITHVDGLSIGAQPLELTINAGARGHLATLMNEVGLLNGQKDDLGYTGLTSPVVLGGSLDDIDQTQWKELLIKAAMRKAAGGLLDKLLGK